MKSKHCAGCKYWEKEDKASEEYQKWKEAHTCDINFEGSAGAMEPHGTVEMFKQSPQYKIRYTRLIGDGDTKTHNMLLEQQPHGSTLVEKCDCMYWTCAETDGYCSTEHKNTASRPEVVRWEDDWLSRSTHGW